MEQAEAEALFQTCLAKTGPVLCLDIGTGTQDVLLALPGVCVENWPKFVLPSPACRIEQELVRLGQEERDVWLCGQNMGGGFAEAARDLIKKGHKVAATSEAATALHNDPERVRAMGLEISETCPAGFVPLSLGDFDLSLWHTLLAAHHLPAPNLVLCAVQDHGFQGKGSGNRKVRMARYASLLEQNPDPVSWLLDIPPAEMTRMRAVHLASGGPVADTATAVLLGAMLDPVFLKRSFREGVTFVNVGNGHIFAALVYRGLVRGIYEHHTSMRTRDELLADLGEFRRGFLPCDVVQQGGGHGTAYGPVCEEASYVPTFICGPGRAMLSGCGQFIAPFGSMMLAGSMGLLWAFCARMEQGLSAQ